MKITGLGKFIIFVLVIGIAIGGWRAWQAQSVHQGAGASGKGGWGSGFTNNLPQTSGSGGQSNDSGGSGSGGTGNGDIVLVTSASKKGWLLDEIEKFNAQNNGAHVTTKFIETREAMHAILEGKVRPALWSPSSVIWTARLAQAWREKHNASILNTSDPNSYRVFFRTPLVFLTTKQKAAFLRPLLASPRCWDNIADLGTGRKKAPWGRFKWSHADPLNANSGMMTLGLVLADFSSQTGGNGDWNDMANSAAFRTRMLAIESGLVYDLPAQGGSSALTKAFVSDSSRYDMITAYENSALEAASQNPNLAVIYPNPTAISENVVAALSTEGMSQSQIDGAKAFIQFLGRGETLRDGLRYYLRPAQEGSGLSLDRELRNHRGQGFEQTFSSVELPPYEALNSAAFAWRIYKAHKSPNE